VCQTGREEHTAHLVSHHGSAHNREYIAHPHVWRVLALARNLFRPERRRGKCAHRSSRTARGAGHGAQWPGDSEPHRHCVSGEGGETARAAGEGGRG